MKKVNWKIFTGSRTPHDFAPPEPPPWRRFQDDAPVIDVPDGDDRDEGNPGRGQFYCVDAAGEQVRYVNAAIHLRRPLLVTGKPGVGKSSLAYAIAYELKLGPVLRWPITSRASLSKGCIATTPSDASRNPNFIATARRTLENTSSLARSERRCFRPRARACCSLMK
jgi:hypothetical protein